MISIDLHTGPKQFIITVHEAVCFEWGIFLKLGTVLVLLLCKSSFYYCRKTIKGKIFIIFETIFLKEGSHYKNNNTNTDHSYLIDIYGFSNKLA